MESQNHSPKLLEQVRNVMRLWAAKSGKLSRHRVKGSPGGLPLFLKAGVG